MSDFKLAATVFLYCFMPQYLQFDSEVILFLAAQNDPINPPSLSYHYEQLTPQVLTIWKCTLPDIL
jgi:hypothetical protein